MERMNYFHPLLAIGLSFALSLTVACGTGLCQEQLSAPRSESAQVADDAQAVADEATTPVSYTPNASGEINFPHFDSENWYWTPIDSLRSVPNSSYELTFGLVKLALTVACVFWWLHCLKVSSSVSDSRVSAKEQLDSRTNWTTRLFICGLAGICFAVILPSTAISAGVMIVATGVPYTLFVNAQNRLQDSSAPRLSYFPRVPKQTSSPVVFDEVKASLDGDSPPLNTSIRFIGKSSSTGQSHFGLSRSVEDSQAFQYVLAMIAKAVASCATDLHINSRTHHVEVRQRVDGTLEPLPDLPRENGLAVINILKVVSELSIADRKKSQDGSFQVEVDGRQLSFRVSSQGTQSGEKLSIRILDPSKSSTRLRALGMPIAIEESIERQLQNRHGLVLFVGATGAGKSTTACAALQMIDSSRKNIVSIEDPVEYQIPSIDQIEVNLKAGQTFQSALRSVLRLDADVIFVGEIRDAETAKIALQAAQAGQLVLATMHATDSVGGFQRLSDLTGDPTGVASAVRAIVAQTLVRKLCPTCRTEYSPDAHTATTVGSDSNESLYRSSTELVLHCPTCDGRRFVRRTGVYELTEVTSEMRGLIRDEVSQSELSAAAQRGGMIPLRDHAATLVREGVISLNELNRVLGD